MIIFLTLAVAYLFIDSLFATHWIQKLERRIIDLELDQRQGD